jgi:hypothetical protein
MAPAKQNRTTNLAMATFLARITFLLLAMIPPATSAAPARGAAGWQLETSEPPGYAVIEPAKSNVNVDSVALACGEIHGRRGLQLELYLSNAGPLLPDGASYEQLNKVPRAEIVIDGRTFAADILFAGDFLVVVDQESDSTMVSDRLLDEMEKGRTMTIRFDLLIDEADGGGEFDGELLLDLQAGRGGSAVAAVRRCTRAESHWSSL